MKARDKILRIEDLVVRVRRARRRRESIVLTNGCFDLLHVGHVRSLEEARQLGDRLIVAVNSDASVRRLKGPERPVQSSRERMEILAALESVDWVVGFAAKTPFRVIDRIRPDVLAKGGDWAINEIVGRELVEAAGGHVVRLGIISGYRSGELIERIRKSTPRHKR